MRPLSVGCGMAGTGEASLGEEAIPQWQCSQLVSVVLDGRRRRWSQENGGRESLQEDAAEKASRAANERRGVGKKGGLEGEKQDGRRGEGGDFEQGNDGIASRYGGQQGRTAAEKGYGEILGFSWQQQPVNSANGREGC